MAKMKNILIQQDLDDTIVTLEKKPTGITDEDWKKMTWVHQLVLGSTHWNFNGEGVSDGA